MSNITPVLFQNSVMTAFGTFWADRSQIVDPNGEFARSKVPDIDDTFIEWSINGETAGQVRYSNSVSNNFF